jgi:hypothetical protein
MQRFIEQVDQDLGTRDVGPGCRKLGVIKRPKALIPPDAPDEARTSASK